MFRTKQKAWVLSIPYTVYILLFENSRGRFLYMIMAKEKGGILFLGTLFIHNTMIILFLSLYFCTEIIRWFGDIVG